MSCLRSLDGVLWYALPLCPDSQLPQVSLAVKLELYDVDDVGAPIASGSFATAGMVIIPCSMKTLAAVANGYADNLIVRAADVMLKERRRLIVVARETPLNEIHLENMLRLTRAGAIIVPPVPAFYNHPRSLDDIVNHLVGRVLDLLGLPNNLSRRWGEAGQEVEVELG